MGAPAMAWAGTGSKGGRTGLASPTPPSLLHSAPSSSPSVGPLTFREGISVAVVDANALIAASAKLCHLAPRFATLREALNEVRDPQSRALLASLPVTVECLSPSDDALARVVQFARETGDLQALSTVDLKLLALALTLESQAYGTSHLRTTPPPLQLATSKSVQDKELPGWGSNVPNLEEWEEISHDLQPTEDAQSQSHILGVQSLGLDSLSIDSNTNLEESSQETADTQYENFREASGKKNRRSQIKKFDPNLEGKLMVAVGLDTSREEQDEHCGDDFVNSNWQTAVSRSTRRKHEKQVAARQSTELASTSEIGMSYGSREKQHTSVENPFLQSDDQHRSTCQSQLCQACNSTLEEQNHHVIDGSDTNLQNFVHTPELDSSCESHVTEKTANEDECIFLKQEDEGTISEDDQTSIKRMINCSETDVAESEQSWVLQPLSQSTVACITADFAMQNVLLQMGLRVLSPNGLQVYKLHRWVLKCHACNKVTMEVGRIFCPKCGNGGTLDKVSVTIGSNGIVLTGHRRRRTNIRGTRYSLPLPKGGRNGMSENPILREDQLPNKLLYPKSKMVTTDLFDGLYKSDMFLNRNNKNVHRPPVKEALALFSGRRNPNDCHFARKR